MNSKTTWTVTTVVIVIVLFVFFGPKQTSPGDTAPEPETLTVGFSGALTGPLAWFGELYIEGASVALQEINASGGINGRQVEFLIEDNEYSGKGGVSSFRALESKGADVIVSIGSVPTVPLSPLARDAGIPLFASAVFADILTENKNSINFFVTAEEEVRVTMADMKSNGVQDVGIVYINNEFGVANLEAFLEAASRQDLHVVATEAFNPGTTDHSTAVLKMLSNDIDALYVIDLRLVDLIDEIKTQLGKGVEDVGIYTSNIPVNSSVIYQSAETFEGVHVTITPVAIEGSPEREAFLHKFNEEKQIELEESTLGWIATAYDNLYAIKTILEKNPDTSKFAETFASHGVFEGANGTVNLNGRNIGYPLYPAIVKDGKLEKVEVE